MGDADNEARSAAGEWMRRQDAECPDCKSKGPWEFGDVELLQDYNPTNDIYYLRRIVSITCQECGHEMPDFEES